MLEKLTGGICTDGQTCPAVYAEQDGMVLVQGDLVTRTDVALGEGEVLVRLPASLLVQATQTLGR